MNLIQLIIMSFFDITAIHIITMGVLKKRISFMTYIISSSIFSILSGTIVCIIEVQALSIVITAIVMVLMIKLIYKKDLATSFYIYVLAAIIIILTQLIVILFLGRLIDRYEVNFNNGLLSQCIAIIMILILVKLQPISLLYNFLIEKNTVFKQIMANIFIALFAILIYWHLDTAGVIKHTIIISIITMLLVFVNLAVIKNGLRNQYLEKELKIYKTYNPIIEELVEEIKAYQHDFDNHLHALNILMEESSLIKDEALTSYMKELKEKNKICSLIKLKSKLVAAILFSKSKLAKNNNASLIIDIKAYHFNTQLTELQQVEILSILLDNAIETEVEENEIYLNLNIEDQMNVILVRNKHPYLSQEILNNMFNKKYSTKKEKNRGYGLYNLKKIINEINGKIIVKNEKINHQNYVVIKLMFN